MHKGVVPGRYRIATVALPLQGTGEPAKAHHSAKADCPVASIEMASGFLLRTCRRRGRHLCAANRHNGLDHSSL